MMLPYLKACFTFWLLAALAGITLSALARDLSQEVFAVVDSELAIDNSVTADEAPILDAQDPDDILTAEDITGGFRDPDVSVEEQDIQEEDLLPLAAESPTDAPQEPGPPPGPPPLERNNASVIGALISLCGCVNVDLDFEPEVDDIRSISNRFLSGGIAPSSSMFTNMVWAWGQFLDHDLVATIDLEADGKAKVYNITLVEGSPAGPVNMTVLRLRGGFDEAGCRVPEAANTPEIDAGPVYGNDKAFQNDVIRKPGSCYLRTSPGNLLPVTTDPEVRMVQQDDGPPLTQKNWFFIAGDLRVNEHAVLTSMHTLWLREHNRICKEIDTDAQYNGLKNWQKFQLARNVVRAKFQQVTVNEFLPLFGITKDDLKAWTPTTQLTNISVEFATAGYRFGHDMVPDTLGRFTTKDIFQGEEFFDIKSGAGSSDPDAANEKMEDLIAAVAGESANEIDGRLSDTLRNTLFGAFGEDLASRNIFRARELGMQGYNALTQCFNTKAKLPNAIDVDDAFLGLLKERRNRVKKPLGDTSRNIMIDQFHRIFFGKQGTWWGRKLRNVKGFVAEIRSSNLLKSVIEANTDLKLNDNIWIMSDPDQCSTGCVSTFDKCSGKGVAGSKACCSTEDHCVKKNGFYSQCRPKDRTIPNDWKGTILECA